MTATSASWASDLDVGESRIVGGQPTEQGRWPDVVGVVSNGSVICTGTLVAPAVAITAAHCVGGIAGVLIGSTDYQTDQGEYIAVVEEIAHPDWGVTGPGSDIAVLLLARDSIYPPRAIASGCILDELRNGAEVTAVGYGATDVNGQVYGSVLNEVDMPVTDADCSQHRDCVGIAAELRAGGDGIDSCFGDSGGPLFLRSKFGDFLVGATSRGLSTSQLPCYDGGIYTRPDAFLDWIERTASIVVEEPSCIVNQAPVAQRLAETATTGQVIELQIEASDPDQEDGHGFAITEQPTSGTATIDADGILRYTSNVGFVGTDRVVVEVVDTGVPVLTGEVEVAIEVLAAEDDPDNPDNPENPDGEQAAGDLVGGCSTGGNGSPWFLALALLAVVRRRQRP